MLWLCAVLAIHYVFCTSVHDKDHTHHWAPEPLYVCVCICRRVSLCHLLFRLGSVDWIRIDYAFCLAAMASYQYILPWHIPETAIAIQYTRFAILHPANEKSFEPKQRQQRQQRKKKLQTLCCVNVCVYNKRHVSVRFIRSQFATIFRHIYSKCARVCVCTMIFFVCRSASFCCRAKPIKTSINYVRILYPVRLPGGDIDSGNNDDNDNDDDGDGNTQLPAG